MSRKISLFFAFAITALAQSPTGERWFSPTRETGITGEIYFYDLASNIPDRWRGDGRKLGYLAGANFWYQNSSCGFGFFFNTGGAARFDNNDFAEFGPKASCKIPHSRIFAVIENWNLATLATAPAIDPASRRPNSYLNQTWVGGAYKPSQNKFGFREVQVLQGIRGNAPLFSPDAKSRPYVSINPSAQFMYRLIGLDLKDRIDLFATDSFGRG